MSDMNIELCSLDDYVIVAIKKNTILEMETYEIGKAIRDMYCKHNNKMGVHYVKITTD